MIEILNWPNLGTAASVATLTAVITQVIKRYVGIDPKWISLIVAAAITFSHQVYAGDYAFPTFVLSALNAVISAGTAVGAFEGVIKPAKQYVDGHKTDQGEEPNDSART